MKGALIFALLLIIFLKGNAQVVHEDTVAGAGVCNHIVKLLREDSILELSRLVSYPLKRCSPVPDIATPDAFILYYPVLFDSSLKQLLNKYVPTQDGIFYYQGCYGILGEVWIGEGNGKIWEISYRSQAEIRLQQVLEEEARNTIYTSLRKYDKNFIVGATEKYIFRVDYVNDSARLAYWHVGHSMLEKPDVVVYGKRDDMWGSGPWWGFTFKDGDWTYTVEYEGHSGLGLAINFKEKQKYYAAFKEIK